METGSINFVSSNNLKIIKPINYFQLTSDSPESIHPQQWSSKSTSCGQNAFSSLLNFPGIPAACISASKEKRKVL